MWTCISTVTDEWVLIGGGSGGSFGDGTTFILKEGETPAQNDIPAFGSGAADEMIVSNCTFNSELNAISCSAGTVGQSMELIEASANRSHAFIFKAADAITATKTWVTGAAARLPEDILEPGAKRCSKGTTAGALRAPHEPFDRTMTITSAKHWCVPTGGTSGDDCSVGGGNIQFYECAVGAGIDFPTDCTNIGSLVPGTEYAVGTSFTPANGGDVPAGNWFGIDVTSPSSSSAHTVCVTFGSQ